MTSMPGDLVVPPSSGGLTSCEPSDVTHTMRTVGGGGFDAAVFFITSSSRSVRYTRPKWLTPRVICTSQGVRGSAMNLLH